MFFIINCRQRYCCEATLGGIHHVLSRSSIKFFQRMLPYNEENIRGNISQFFSKLVRINELCQRCSDACVKLGQEMGVKVDLFTALQKRDDWMDACFTWFLASLLLPLPLLQQLLLVVPLLLLWRRRGKRRRKSLLKSLMMTWVLVYFTKPCVLGVYFLMVYFRNVSFFGEF
ncbi:hypothetical protein RGQ29_029257 [Quercus rubra]|uniref:Uncharacterized protein n=1 Tax=Quercus rubra TaxID=3512 RepID=A0AAN7EUK3_QUERU|nr:hypothetical protein RGQ29_029257 [Quercus rubra]